MVILNLSEMEFERKPMLSIRWKSLRAMRVIMLKMDYLLMQ